MGHLGRARGHVGSVDAGSVYHIGFVIGPSINASGRLDSAIKALDLLLEEDISKASNLAKELRELNTERKQMTNEGVDKIVKTIESTTLKDDKVIIIYEPEVHESIAGIIAGRVKEKYFRPTIILTNGKEGIKGSGRSIDGYNLYEELSKCKDLLGRFGGHPMAAGLSLKYENIDTLRTMLNQNVMLSDDDLIPKIYIDMQLPIEYISFKLIDELKILEPFGKGNNKPLFGEKRLKIKRGFVLGANRNVLKLKLENDKKRVIEGMYFGDIINFEDKISTYYGEKELSNMYKGIDNNIKIDILYFPSINEYNGNTTLQVIIQHFRLQK